MNNLDPDRFTFWMPPEGAAVLAGAERQPLALPACPLPLHGRVVRPGGPSDAEIGQGLYDYLRQFPECEGNSVYAGLLRDAYPHFITDLAAHAVMLDAKTVEPAYVLRKLTCLKILRLIQPQNPGLLLQLCRGYFNLSLEFSELARSRQHLREAMRFGQELLAASPEDPNALSLLAEIDLLFGDVPAAVGKWQRLAARIDDPDTLARIEARIALQSRDSCPERPLVDNLETVAEAMRLHAEGDDEQATALLEQLGQDRQFTAVFPSADFHWLLGLCRKGCGDIGGAVCAWQQALDIEPGHAAARAELASLLDLP